MRIAVVLAPDFGSTLPLLEGARGAALAHSGVELLPLEQEQAPILRTLVQRGQVDGVIAAYVSDRALESDAKVRRVNISTVSRIRSIPSIVVDELAVGQLARQHFETMGLVATACLANPAHYGARLRSEGFQATLPPPETFGDWRHGDTLRAWIRTLPEGAGVYCTTDRLACRVATACLELGRPVPDDIAILGTGDEAAANLLSPIPLSTIPLPEEQLGRQAVEHLLSGSDASPQPLAPLPPVMRESTGWRHPANPALARAINYIHRHLDAPPDIPRLARHACLSRRALELHFRATFHTSPAALWRLHQIRLAVQLLQTTTRSLDQIADQTGFSGASHLIAAFKRAGLGTPGSHRHP